MTPEERSSGAPCSSTSSGVPCSTSSCNSSSSGSCFDQGPSTTLVPIPGTQKFVKAVHYAEPAYWDERYQREVDDFEWFLGYRALRRLLKATMSKTKPCLQIGCGTSNVQEGMAKAGHTVVNLDISPVVVEQMQERHRGVERLTYAIGDCRDMREIVDCQFGSVLEKGTLDALLCSKNAEVNTHRMMSEISRVLLPGGTFLLVSLGPPSKRLHMINRPDYCWTVSVVLLPKLSADQQANRDGKPINDANRSIKYLGPWAVTAANEIPDLPADFDPSRFFYGYICRKQLLQLSGSSSARSQLPESWASNAREVAARMQQELGLPADIFSKGMRRRIVRVPKGSPMHALATSARALNPFNRDGGNLPRHASLPDLTTKAVAASAMAMLNAQPSETSSDDTDVVKALRPALSADSTHETEAAAVAAVAAAVAAAAAPAAAQALAHATNRGLAASDSVRELLLTLPMQLQLQVQDGTAAQIAEPAAPSSLCRACTQQPAAAGSAVRTSRMCLSTGGSLSTSVSSSSRSTFSGNEQFDGPSGKGPNCLPGRAREAAAGVAAALEEGGAEAAHCQDMAQTVGGSVNATAGAVGSTGAQVSTPAAAAKAAAAIATTASHKAAATALAAEVAAASPAAALGMALLLQGRAAGAQSPAAAQKAPASSTADSAAQ